MPLSAWVCELSLCEYLAVFANKVKQSSGFRRKDAALSGLPRRLRLLPMTGILDYRVAALCRASLAVEVLLQ